MLRLLAIAAIALWLAATVAINVVVTDLAPAPPSIDTLADAFI